MSDDGVHPSFDGYEAMRKLWAETMYKNVYSAEQNSTDNTDVKGDVNADGKFNVADVVMMQKWILNAPDSTLTDWKSGDICADNRIDCFDLVMMKKMLTESAK